MGEGRGIYSVAMFQKISSPFGGEIFSGRSRGVEVYPRQGKSPLEHQKISPPFGGEIFSGCYTALSPLSGSAGT